LKAKKLSILSVDKTNINLLEQFIKEYEDDEGHFRYFTSRNASIIKNHLATFLLLLNEEPIGYGHLDKDGDIVWLGIAIKTHHQGKGLGKLLMQMLISQARVTQLQNVHLSVDNSNSAGIKLYNKYGFIDSTIDDDKRRMIWTNPNFNK